MPNNCVVVIRSPAKVVRVATGAAAPTFSDDASARDESAPLQATKLTAANCRSIARRSERIGAPDRGAPVREQLVALQLAVHRNLHECVDMQRVQHAHRDAGADIGDGALGVGRVSQRAFIRSLVRQIDLQLRYPLRTLLVPQPEADGCRIARFESSPG